MVNNDKRETRGIAMNITFLSGRLKIIERAINSNEINTGIY